MALLLEFGLGSGDGGPWRRLLGDRQDSPREMIEDLLMAAAGHGFTDRVRGLLARGVDPEGRGSKHPIYQGRSPVEEAALAGHMDVVSLLVDAGASWEHDAVDELVATAMAGDRGTVERLLAADPGLRRRAIERCPDQLVRAAEALEHPDASTPLTEERVIPTTQTGAAMRTVTAAFTAVSEGRFDELGSMLAAEIDWQGLADEDGQIPRCHGRAEALQRMRIGLLANGEVSVSAFVEAGDRVLAHVHRVGDDELERPERFLVAEVHEGQITNLDGYATEPEASDALHAGAPPESPHPHAAARSPRARRAPEQPNAVLPLSDPTRPRGPGQPAR